MMIVFIPLYLRGQPKVWTAFWVPDDQYMRDVMLFGSYKFSRVTPEDRFERIGNVSQPTTTAVMALPHMRRRVEIAEQEYEGAIQ